MTNRTKYNSFLRCCLVAVALVFSLSSPAKSLREMWVNMPDSVLATLDRNLRLELVELADMKVKAEVKDKMGGDCVMDTLTANFLQVRLGKTVTLQMKMLPREGADSLLCVVKTLAAPEKESEVAVVDPQWNPIAVDHLFGGKSMDEVKASLVQRPDTMSQEEYDELDRMMELRLVSALVFAHDNSIVFRLSTPLISSDDKKRVNAIKLQRKFNWNGKSFNEG